MLLEPVQPMYYIRTNEVYILLVLSTAERNDTTWPPAPPVVDFTSFTASREEVTDRTRASATYSMQMIIRRLGGAIFHFNIVNLNFISEMNSNSEK